MADESTLAPPATGPNDAAARGVKKLKRRREILAATLRLVRRKGANVSTAEIASAARCSKETLYNWFGDRDGLMLAVVREQALATGVVLERSFEQAEGSLEERMKACCTVLLDVLTGDSAVAANRIAMAQACDARSDFGEALLAEWKEQAVKPFSALFQEGNAAGSFAVHSADEAFENLMGLLVGDRQRQLLLGRDGRPRPAAMAAMANKAVQRWLILYGV
ncbi:MAG: TetR/AcrR family transcriptional regulator [Pseudomonadota bacterium]